LEVGVSGGAQGLAAAGKDGVVRVGGAAAVGVGGKGGDEGVAVAAGGVNREVDEELGCGNTTWRCPVRGVRWSLSR
jgi:hypothetical protein